MEWHYRHLSHEALAFQHCVAAFPTAAVQKCHTVVTMTCQRYKYTSVSAGELLSDLFPNLFRPGRMERR